MKEEQKRPRPTVDQLNEIEQLKAKLHDAHLLSDDARDEAKERLDKLFSSYDWTNYKFTDPATGKKGVKNAVGQILVPADYEDFTFVGDRYLFDYPTLGAKKDGKYGIVAADGSDHVFTDFRFDALVCYPYATMYQAYWDGMKDKFGLVTGNGTVLVPDVLTACHEPWNDFVLLEGDGKYGALDLNTLKVVVPEYDKVDLDDNEEVVFHKDGVEGYIVEDTGEFVPKDKIEDDEEYVDVYFYNTYDNDMF